MVASVSAVYPSSTNEAQVMGMPDTQMLFFSPNLLPASFPEAAPLRVHLRTMALKGSSEGGGL